MCRIGALIGDLKAAAPYVAAFREFGHANRDGAGIGTLLADGASQIHKSARSALDDPGFALDALPSDARSAVMHVRAATAGATKLENAHPFHVGDHVFAHNGTVGAADKIEDALGPNLQRLGVRGDTDSERYGALLEQHREQAGGDIVEGYRRTVAMLADEHPMTSLNSVSVRPNGDVYALRYPENRTLFWKRTGARDAEAGHRLLTPPSAGAAADAAAGAGTMAGEPGLTVIASRPLDATAGWQELQPGELLHVRADDLGETVHRIVDREPARRFADAHMDEGAEWIGPRRSVIEDANLGA